MSAPDKGLSNYATTIWLFAVVALLTLSLSGNNVSGFRKDKYLDGCSLNQIAGESAILGNPTTPQILLTLDPADSARLIGPTAIRLKVSRYGSHFPSHCRNERAQGRAPPIEIL
ncbi:hypothetical protein ACFSSA_08235 [Luteolibacter algae]|uniref:Uncharacterized protein n=1 Tax=Luteolibacter algae TaxID=454151 RepID=A0ABW5D7C4_9BACT